MASAPIYISRLPTGGLGELQPSQGMPGQITGQAAAQFGNALGGLGQAALQAAATIEHVNRASTLADRQTKYLTDIDQVHQEFQNDQDPTTAPDRFAKRIEGIKGEALKGLGQEDSAELNLKLSRQAISYQGSVRDGALKKQADSYSAGLDKQYEVLTRRYAQAGSDAEREGIAAELDDTLSTGIKQGMTTAKGAEAYRQSLIKTGDSAVITREIGRNPTAALASLNDPTKFTGLDPVQREQFTKHAQEADQQLRQKRLQYRAKTDPVGAAFEAGMVSDPAFVGQIFQRAFIPQESGGNPNAVSPAGALGLAQVMPGTAREVATRHGISEIANLPEGELRERLLTDPKLNRRLGELYFSDNLKLFDNNLAATIASYHAGPHKAVKAAHEAATAKYGIGYSPAQFLEVMDPNVHDGKGGKQGKRTVDYVRDIYKRMGVDVSQPGFSGMGSFTASNIVGAELDRQKAERDKIISQYTSVAAKDADEFGPLLKDGVVVDAPRLGAIRSTLQLGAERGDVNSISAMRRLNEHMEVAPIAQQAWRLRPEELEAATSQMRQQITAGGSATPEMARRLKVFEDIQSKMSTARKENPIALRERQGEPVTKINLQAQPNDPEFNQQLAMRGIAAARAQKEFGGEYHFFMPEEKITAKARFEGMAEDERFGMLRAISENTPNQEVYLAAVKDITGGDKLAGIAGRFMRSNPGLAKEIFRGASVMQLDSVKAKAEEVRNVMRTIGPSISGYPATMKSDIMEAASAVYAARRGKNGTLWDPTDRAGMEEAYSAVIGKTATINGAKVPVPREISTWQFEQLFGSSGRISDETIAKFGGAAGFGGQKLDAGFLRRHAQLVPDDDRVGDHRSYMVFLPQGGVLKAVMQADGKKPLVLDMLEAIKLERIAADHGRMNSPGGALRQGQRDFLARNASDLRPTDPVIVPGEM